MGSKGVTGGFWRIIKRMLWWRVQSKGVDEVKVT